jgi:hypothetical protein
MADYRDMLAANLAQLAPTLGDCPACYGLGQLHKVVGTDAADNDLVYDLWSDDFCGGSGWLRRRGAPSHRPTFALPPSQARSYARAEAGSGATNGGSPANDSEGAGPGLRTGGAGCGKHRQERTIEPTGQGRGRGPAARRQGPAVAEGRGTYAGRPPVHATRNTADVTRRALSRDGLRGDRVA